MNVHFICRGNVLRSLIAETYLRSLQLPGVMVESSGTNVDLLDPIEREYFANTISLLKRHNIDKYAKNTSHQLTQKRIEGHDVIVCMNQRVVEESKQIVLLPKDVIDWNIVDIGEGHRTVAKDIRLYEEEIFGEITLRVDLLAKRISIARSS